MGVIEQETPETGTEAETWECPLCGSTDREDLCGCLRATYDPADNKLRLRAEGRLDRETYDMVKAAGFRWAPRQELFVAPAWTPEREDLLLALCGEIGDEDTSLVDRAEERAERFEEYSERRAEDAERAREAVAELADGIPLGQPILVGHHSQRRAEKDAERIERGMRRAVNFWDTSVYWQRRARGAIRHAKYKERPEVRARRIKTLEAEERKQLRMKTEAEKALRIWSNLHKPDGWGKPDGTVPTFRERALYVAGRTRTAPYGVWSDLSDGKITPEEARDRAVTAAQEALARAERWLAHLGNRLAYERAMLEDAGGTAADRVSLEVGGAVRCWSSPGHGRGWSYIRRVNKVTVTVEDNWGNGGANFTRTIELDKLLEVMSAAQVAAAREEGRLVETEDGLGFFLVDAPGPEGRPQPRAKPEGAEPFEALRGALREGVQAVSAPQLFPTPEEVGARVVDLADLLPGQRILEPEVGTGALLQVALDRLGPVDPPLRVVAVEINRPLVEAVHQRAERWRDAYGVTLDLRCADFLSLSPEDLGGRFDRIIMNPPFERGADIEHILHARRFLLPDGHLVAVCANGPRQQARLQPIAREWIDLPAGSFEVSGTGVNTAIVVIEADPQG